ncbi:MAG: FAD:protein FMN transferase [Chloroflexi bacterium]|nr:FAD:protein FMN transferase [Chloroflexota bacterium]
MSIMFRAMSTDVRVLAPTLSADEERRLGRQVAEVFEASERRFSRFRPDSELSRLNRAGQLSNASAPFLAALARAHRFFRHSGGLFDPTVGGALIAAGYDRSSESATPVKTMTPDALRTTTSFGSVAVDRFRRTITLPPGVSLDFGGFIKGWTVDQAARLVPSTAAIDAGGDAMLRGAGPDGRGWIVDVENPADPTREVLTIRVRDRAVATSAPNRRRWRTAQGEMHHLINPWTGRPAESDLAQVTVLGDTVEVAEVLAKTAFFLGASEGRHFLHRLHGVAAVLVRANGRVEVVGKLEEDRAA